MTTAARPPQPLQPVEQAASAWWAHCKCWASLIVPMDSVEKALAEQGETRGLIGPLELPRLWTRHILNSAIAAPLFDGRAADIGSGAGLPGIVLAIARPDVTWTLVEPMERRVAWLTEQADALDLGNVTVVRARAEEWVPEASVDVVTARAVSALRTLIPHPLNLGTPLI